MSKLSEQELETFRQVAMRGDGNSLIKNLVDHIDAIEAEYVATMQQVVKDAYASGAAVGDFIKEQTDRIEALEKTIRKVIYGVRGIDLQCEKWVTAELSRVLPGYEHIGGSSSESDDQKANGSE